MMNYYKANSSLVFTDADGRQIDTFVVFDTDPHTGLTHINHESLKVAGECLRLHSKTACDYHMLIADSFSFEMIRKLRDKYTAIDSLKKATVSKMPEMQVLAHAS